MKHHARLFLLAVVVLAACTEEMPTCRPDLAGARAQYGTAGAGSFGYWYTDIWGLPAYAYTLDERSDPRADWENTEERVRNDHWHLVGNRRVNATAYNLGYTQLYDQELGHELLNRYDPESNNWGGGFSVIQRDNEPPQSLAHAWAHTGEIHRDFGIGYSRQTWCDDGLKVDRIFYAPEDDGRYWIQEVQISNQTDTAMNLIHDEIWDANRHYLQAQELRSGVVTPDLPQRLDQQRADANDTMQVAALVDGNSALVSWQSDIMPEPSSHTVSYNDRPPSLVVAALNHDVDAWGTDANKYWGTAGPTAPTGLLATLQDTDAVRNNAGLIARTNLVLQPNTTTTLRYLVAVTDTTDLSIVAQAGASPAAQSLPQSLAARKDYLPMINASAIPAALAVSATAYARESMWHAYYLRSMGGYQRYPDHYVVNQGSAYWYLHGLDGALRDFVFSAAALAHFDPWLARETLLYAAGMRFEAGGALAYTVANRYELSHAVIHDAPSDLELFLWWGVAEYIAATQDWSILDEEISTWPHEDGEIDTLRGHLVRGFRYLRDEIGTGPNGLIRLGSGDWDDSITFFAESRERARAEGESVANTAMAVFILPWLDVIFARHVSTAHLVPEVRLFLRQQQEALDAQWTGSWYRRAWFGADAPFGDQAVFLFSNALAMVARAPDKHQAADLTAALDQYLIAPSNTSMFQFHYLDDSIDIIDGVTDEGASNPAITMLGVWGLAHYDSDAAWAATGRNTMMVKADAYPDIWYGIWSGPDSQYTNVHALAGQTWASPATPMRDYPIMNSNAHNGPLLSYLRASGVYPVVDTSTVPAGLTLSRKADW